MGCKIHLEGSKDRISEVLQREPYFKYIQILCHHVEVSPVPGFLFKILTYIIVLFPTLSKFFKLPLQFVSLIQPYSTQLWGSLFPKKKNNKKHHLSKTSQKVSPFGPGIGSKAEGFVPEVRETLLKSSRVASSRVGSFHGGELICDAWEPWVFGRLPRCCFFVFDVFPGRCWKMKDDE